MKLIERKFALVLLAGAALSVGIFAGCSDGSSGGDDDPVTADKSNDSKHDEANLSTITAEELSFQPGVYNYTMTIKFPEEEGVLKITADSEIQYKGTESHTTKGTLTFGSSPKTSPVKMKYQEESHILIFSSKEYYDAFYAFYAQKDAAEANMKYNLTHNGWNIADIKCSWDEKNRSVTVTGKDLDESEEESMSYDEFFEIFELDEDEDGDVTYTDRKIQQNASETVIVVSYTENDDGDISYWTVRMEKQ